MVDGRNDVLKGNKKWKAGIERPKQERKILESTVDLLAMHSGKWTTCLCEIEKYTVSPEKESSSLHTTVLKGFSKP